jgi:very-short-patch-repair endonuclease
MEKQIKIKLKENKIMSIGDRIKGKTYEEFYGQDKAKAKIRKYIESRKNYIVSEETKNKISNTLKDKKLSPESIRKRTKTRKILFLEGKLKTNKGFKFSEESRKKLSMVHKGKPLSEEHKRKIGLNTKKYRKNQIFPLIDTSIEIKIQNYLKQLGVEFYTHQYKREIEHSYPCDIMIPSMNLIIECDGDYWHANPIKYPNPSEKQRIQITKDKIRTKELIEKGYKVFRLWENEIRRLSLDDFKNKLNNQLTVKGGSK